MNIRLAEEKDIPGILELLRQVNNVHADGRPDLFLRDKTKYTAEELRALLADRDTPVLLGCNDADEVLGYGFCRIDVVEGENNLVDRRELYIDDICFDEKERGKGYAKQLYDALCEYAREQGCSRITLHAWECNPRAVRFYEKCGMKPYFYAMEQKL